jgi:hypothetical protein
MTSFFLDKIMNTVAPLPTTHQDSLVNQEETNMTVQQKQKQEQWARLISQVGEDDNSESKTVSESVESEVASEVASEESPQLTAEELVKIKRSEEADLDALAEINSHTQGLVGWSPRGIHGKSSAELASQKAFARKNRQQRGTVTWKDGLEDVVYFPKKDFHYPDIIYSLNRETRKKTYTGGKRKKTAKKRKRKKRKKTRKNNKKNKKNKKKNKTRRK